MSNKLFYIFLLLIICSCGQTTSTEQKNDKQGSEAFIADTADSSDWEISSPEAEGFNAEKLQQAIAAFGEQNKKLDGLIIARNGKLVAEHYYNGYTKDKLHKIWSITKYFTGTLVGIAKDKNLLSEMDSIGQYLQAYDIDKYPEKKAITIEHLLTMTSGIAWEELGGPKSSGFQLPYSENWIEFILSLPQQHAPEKVFNYSTANTLLLAPILNEATGQHARNFAKENLFKPLDISHYEWDNQSEFWTKTQGGELPGARAPKGLSYSDEFAALTNTGSGLRMRPRDMCKLGQLYLDSGQWNNQQVVSKEWVDASIVPHFGNNNYGYHWKLRSFSGYPCYFASGFGEQRVFVFPTLNMVIVTTQHHYTTMPQGNRLTDEFVNAVLNSINK